MLRNLFNPENQLMILMSQITDCILLSMFWFLCCIPIITIGAASAALYDATFHTFRKGEMHPYHRFFRSFKENLKSSILSSILFVILVVILTKLGISTWNQAVYGNISWILFAAIAFLLFVIIGILSLLFPMLSRFQNTTLCLWWNTIALGLGNLPFTLGLAAITTLNVFLCIRLIFPLFFLPALSILLSTLLVEPIFRPYMPENKEQEEETQEL